MSSGLRDLTAHAHRLAAAGNLTGARDRLAAALAGIDLNTVPPSAELVEASGLYARVLLGLGEPHAARGWAALAHSVSRRRYGPDDERTLAASALLAAVLHRVGSLARSAHLYRTVIAGLTAAECPESLRVLAAQADLATVEHARGDCATARQRLTTAWTVHQDVHGEDHLNGIKMLARLGAMARDCGRDDEAADHFALAGRLCRAHLPVGHPLAAQVAELAARAADPAHHCRPERTAEATGTPAETGNTAMQTGNPAMETGNVPAEPSVAAVQPSVAVPAAGTAGVAAVAPRHGPAAGRLLRPPLRIGLVVTLGISAAAGAALVGGAWHVTKGGPGHVAAPDNSPVSDGLAAGPAPAGLALRDNRDTIALTWTYPPDAEGPVVVSGGRTGQPARPLHDLPPGSTGVLVHGFNPNLDYCFSVAVVYATDRISRTDPVCTARNTSTGSPPSRSG